VDENRRLNLLIAELSLHGEALKAVIRKTDGACRVEDRSAVRLNGMPASERAACKLLGVEPSSYRHVPHLDRDVRLRADLVALMRRKPRYGYPGSRRFPPGSSRPVQSPPRAPRLIPGGFAGGIALAPAGNRISHRTIRAPRCSCIVLEVPTRQLVENELHGVPGDYWLARRRRGEAVD
jgi:hypothetical protein